MILPTAQKSRCLRPIIVAPIVLILSGCANLVVKTAPTDSSIVIKDPGGKIVGRGPSPLEASVGFASAQAQYVIEATPSPSKQLLYEVTTKNLSRDVFAQLPGGKRKEFEIKLDEKQYSIICDINVILGDEWMGVVAPSRAYHDTSETGGAVPQRVVELGENRGITGLGLSPDGNTIVYSVATYDSDKLQLLKSCNLDQYIELPVRGAEIHGVSTQGGGVQHITREDFQDMFPSYTSDGKNLLFSSNRRRPKSTDILRITSSGRGGVTDIYIDQRAHRAVMPTQATNGTIAFALYPEKWTRIDEVEIWTVGGPNQFPTQIAKGIQPAISPDGSKIAYIGTDGNLWVVNVDGTEATQLTSAVLETLKTLKQNLSGTELQVFNKREAQGLLLRDYHPCSFPSWSPDGKRIVFTSMQGNDPTGRPNEDIWAMDLKISKLQQLTTNGSTDRFPVVSPDGEWIYFMSNRGGQWAIWRIPNPPAE